MDLSESDLVEMISADGTVLSDFRRRSPRSPNVERLPSAPWIRFYEDVGPLLPSRKANGFVLLAPPKAVAAAAKARAEKIGWLAIHASLAEHFKRQDSVQSARPFDAQRRRIQADMLWHLCEPNDWEALAPPLTSPGCVSLVLAGGNSIGSRFSSSHLPGLSANRPSSSKADDPGCAPGQHGEGTRGRRTVRESWHTGD